MLVHYPESITIHRDDETRTDLAERFQIANLVRTREGGGASSIGSSKIGGQVADGGAGAGAIEEPKGCAGSKRKSLLDGTHWRIAEIESAVGTNAGADTDFFHRRMIARGTQSSQDLQNAFCKSEGGLEKENFAVSIAHLRQQLQNSEQVLRSSMPDASYRA